MSTAKNSYDKHDIVRRESVIIAGPLKLAAYRVRDVETGEMSKLQFHATYDNTVLGVMGEESAKLFARFVTMTIEERGLNEMRVQTADPRTCPATSAACDAPAQCGAANGGGCMRQGD